jgi:thiamine-phosphate pyrophosphorylase
VSTADLQAALRLVVILDAEAAGGRDLPALAAAAERGGATMLQVRAKGMPAGELAALTRRIIETAHVPVVVNDRLDVALAVGAAGCHLGQDDLPLGDARAMAPPGFLLGGSAGTEDEARRAEAAHYLGIGPIHATPSKADAGEEIGAGGFQRVAASGGLPAVAIGGVRSADVPALVAAGAAGVAVIGAVLGAADPAAAARDLRAALDRALR